MQQFWAFKQELGQTAEVDLSQEQAFDDLYEEPATQHQVDETPSKERAAKA